MVSIQHILLIIFYIITPLGILHLCSRYKFLDKLGAIVLAYIVGLIAGNLPIMPIGSEKIQDILTTAVIPLAIPMMLFSANIKSVFALARQSFLSLIIGIISAIIVVIIGFFIFNSPEKHDFHKVAGLLVGVYTGGTPNLAALKLILDVDDTTYLLTHSFDMLVSGFYMLFIMTVAQKVFGLVLQPFRGKKRETNQTVDDSKPEEPYMGLLQRRLIPHHAKSLLFSLLIAALSFVISLAFGETSKIAIIMLSITTLSLLSSFLPKINQIEKSFELGMYLILIFSITVASMANVSHLISGSPVILYYVTFAIFGSLIIQTALSKLFGIDVDTMIITSTALINSAPFVPVVAGALKNREIVVPGITIGIVGYAIGTYAGYLIAELLSSFAILFGSLY